MCSIVLTVNSTAGTYSGEVATYPSELVSRLSSTANGLCGACPEGTKCVGGSVLLPPDIEIRPVGVVATRNAAAGCVRKMSVCGTTQQVRLPLSNF
jgi:hypothetical protein